MLKYRILTAAVLLPIVIFGTLYSSTPSFAAGVGVIAMLAAWEWSRLARVENLAGRIIYAAIVTSIIYAVYASTVISSYLSSLIYTIAALWVLLAVFIMLDPVRHLSNLPAGVYTVTSGLVGLLLLPGMWLAFVTIHALDNGAVLLLAMFVLVWAADTGAYFAGRKWGKHKLAPRVSPGKTWEGVAGGLSLSLLAAFLTPYIIELSIIEIPMYLLVATGTVIISVSGDLFESVFKRVAGYKDSGRVLPGHGGILDRIDSLIAAGPVFMAGLLLLGNAV